MFRKALVLAVMCGMLVNLYGCFALFAGAAAGAGTGVWMSEKLVQEVNAPFENAVSAAKSGMEGLKLEVTKETVEKDSAQIMGKYTDGKTIWIDVIKITETSSKIQVRVGAVNSDKAAASRILKEITRHL